MEQNIQRKGLLNWLLLLVLGGAGAVVAVYARSATGLVGSVFMALGFLVATIGYFQMRLQSREQLEKMEYDELRRAASSGTLFGEAADDSFPARRSREQFEKFFVPAFSILLLLAEIAATYWLWKSTAEDQAASAAQATAAMAIYGLFALVFFQFGKYSAVLARLEKQQLLRPQASYLLLGSVLSFASAGVEVAGWGGYQRVDQIVSRVLIVVLGLVALENLLTMVFEISRPRLKGQAEHPLYESRLIGLLGQPGGLISTAAQALDYQFGFKVSETWFYRLLERALAWLILLQLGVLLLSTTVVFIELGEKGLLERFGAPVQGREVLGPGLHLKFPWPIDEVRRYQTERIQSFLVGLTHEEHEQEPRTQLWSKAHARDEFNLLVASREQGLTNSVTGEQAVPVSLLAVHVPVQYQISDVLAYANHHANANELLERLANSEVTRYLVSVDVNEVMSIGRRKAAEELRQRIQLRADAEGLGVKVLFVGLHGIHPPVKVAPDYEGVIGAMQDKEATNLLARAYYAQRVPTAVAEAAKRTNEAGAYRVRTTLGAAAAAGRFTNQVAAFDASPQVFKARAYLDSIGRATASARKYIVTTESAHDIVTFNLEDKIRADLLDTPLAPVTKKP